MRVIKIDPSGKLYVGDHPEVRPQANEIRIKVYAAGVNRADILQKQGKYPPPRGASDILGLEAAGEVVETGAECVRFKTGDRVFALLSGGGYAEYVTVKESHAMPIPATLSYVDAAAIAEVFVTSYQALFDLAELSNQETVLIHAGASGVGTAAIQLAKEVGATVVVTAGTDEKIAFCEKLGADIGINYRSDPEFDRMIGERPGGGVDVVLDVVGGPYVQRNLNVLNPDGRWVILAFMGGRTGEIDLAGLLLKRIRIVGSTLRARTDDYKSRLIYDFSNRFLRSLEEGRLRPVVDEVYSWTKANDAHRRMEMNENIGKIILSLVD